MEKRVVWIPVKALVRVEVEVIEGLSKQEIFEAAVGHAYELEALHRQPTDDWMLDDDEINSVNEFLLDDLIENNQ